MSTTLPHEFNNAKIIWTKDPSAQTTRINEFDTENENNFKVVTFKKTYSFSSDVTKLKFNIFADTRYYIWINGSFAGRGPVCAGGDFGMASPMDTHYYSTYEVPSEGNTIQLKVLVRLGAVVLTDTSIGKGCFVLGGKAFLADGSTADIVTDESWLCSVDASYPEPDAYDYTRAGNRFENAVEVTNAQRILAKSEIPLLCEDKIPAPGFTPCKIEGEKIRQFKIDFDKIYSAYFYFDCEGDTTYSIKAVGYEFQPDNNEVLDRPCIETIKAKGKLFHIGQIMHSVGSVLVTVKNTGKNSLKINDIGIYYSHYPTNGDNGSFKCNDEDLNNIYDLCRHTLEICRQSIHLDSPLHQENLGCAGDYYIESLMSYYAFADTRLSRFDIVRIGDCLTKNNGSAFHTTYSFIWVQMLYDYYMYTGDESVIHRCKKSLQTLLEAAHSMTDENGLIDNPPNFMFVDWTVTDDGFSRHHPPKSMGQSVMNAFYYNALCRATELFERIYESSQGSKYCIRAKNVKDAFNKYFYDKKRKLYIDGLITPTPKELVGIYMPENKREISFSMYPNILACLYGICPEENAADLLERTLYKENLDPIQMYFMHFALDALYKAGLFEKYGLKEIRRWKAIYDECPKGLKEGWIQLHYKFDYSHAWGGTPMYQLPARISGLEILEPGMKKIRFNPNLYDLSLAKIVIPSPYGSIEIKISDKVEILLPDEIELA